MAQMTPCRKVGPNRLRDVHGEEYSISGGDDGEPVDTEYLMDEDGELLKTEIGAFDRLKNKVSDWRKGRIDKKIARTDTRGGNRVDRLKDRQNRIEEREEERNGDTNKVDREADAVATSGWVPHVENFQYTNPSASVGTTYSIEKLLQVDEFLFRIVDSGSTTTTTLIMSVWAGTKCIQDFGAGIPASLFAATSQIQNTQSKFRAAGGRMLKITVYLAASGIANITLMGEASGKDNGCN